MLDEAKKNIKSINAFALFDGTGSNDDRVWLQLGANTGT